MICLNWFGLLWSPSALFEVVWRVVVARCCVQRDLEGHQVLCLKWSGRLRSPGALFEVVWTVTRCFL